MSKAVLAALTYCKCGRDLIRLSSILSVLNITSVLKEIPQHMRSPDGDFMTLLNVMNELLLVKQSTPANQFNLKYICASKGWTSILPTLRQALRRNGNLERSFAASPEFSQRAQIHSGKWASIAMALLAGYSENVFVSMKELQGKIHRFTRYKNTEDLAILDLQSTLIRPISQAPVCVVLARDIRYSSAVRSKAVISFVGEINPSWIRHQVKRELLLNTEEEALVESPSIKSRIRSKIANFFSSTQNKRHLMLDDEGSKVLQDEFHVRKQLVTTKTFQLENNCPPNTANHENLARNLASVTKMLYIFSPLKWRWEAEKQVKVTVNNNPAKNACEVTVEGRVLEYPNVKKEFDSFVSWLKRAAVIRHPNSGK